MGLPYTNRDFIAPFCSILISAIGRRFKSIDNGTEPFLRESDSNLADLYKLLIFKWYNTFVVYSFISVCYVQYISMSNGISE